MLIPPAVSQRQMAVKRLIPVALALLMASGVAGCLGSFNAEPAPQWQANFAFAYSTTGEFSASFVGKVDGEVVDEQSEGEEIDATFFVQVLDSDVTAADEAAYLAAMAFTSDGLSIAPVAIRHRDLAMVPAEMDGACSGGPCGAAVASDGMPMPTYLDFPLEKGKKWDGTLDFDGLAVVVLESEAVGRETIGLPIGETSAIRVEHKIRLDDVDAMKRLARQEIEADGARLDRFDFEFRGDVTTWYSPAYQAVVKESVSFVSRFDLRVRFEGQVFEQSADISGTAQQVLVGARLIPAAPWAAVKIEQALQSGAGLVDPTGAKVPEQSPYRVTVAVDGAPVNTAAGQSVAITVARADGEALPDGHRLLASVMDGAGNEVARLEGTAMEFTPAEPGVYSVLATAVDGDAALVAAAGAFFVADYHAVVSADCSLVAIAGVPAGCAEFPVPVRPGIESLTVAFGSAGVLPAFGSLVLRAPDGSTFSTPGTTITVTDFSMNGAFDGDWMVEWEPTLMLLDDASYLIDLDFGASAPAETGMQFVLRHADPTALWDRGSKLPSSEP
jgi:hypothetical protein